MDKKIIAAAFLILSIFLSSCQYKEQPTDSNAMEITDKEAQSDENIGDELEKELEDDLDKALEELEEIEKI
ncbi:MAG: hypothetical protein AABX34_00935 [Nanoarchaeota archaeon]